MRGGTMHCPARGRTARGARKLIMSSYWLVYWFSVYEMLISCVVRDWAAPGLVVDDGQPSRQ